MSVNGSFKVSSDQKGIYDFFVATCHIPKPCSCLLVSSIRWRLSSLFQTESGERLYSGLFGKMDTLLQILIQTVLIFYVPFFYFLMQMSSTPGTDIEAEPPLVCLPDKTQTGDVSISAGSA